MYGTTKQGGGRISFSPEKFVDVAAAGVWPQNCASERELPQQPLLPPPVCPLAPVLDRVYPSVFVGAPFVSPFWPMNRLVKNDYFENATPRFDEIKRLLDENGFKEKMEGMKRLIAVALSLTPILSPLCFEEQPLCFLTRVSVCR